MGRHREGQNRAAAGRADAEGYENQMQPADVELDQKHGGDDGHHADIGLLHQQHRDDREHTARRRHTADPSPPLPLRDQPRRRDGEAGFQELARLY